MAKKAANQISRRKFLLGSALTGGGIIASNLFSKSFAQAPGIVTLDRMRPQIPYGVASGDITGNSAVIWSKTDRPARIIVEYSTSETFRNPQQIVGSAAIETTDYTARVYLS
ncbi:MAG TPA: alkaline phosphatase, partial [Cyanobacteria bacterium UBA11368]|nr:alkaline phosphatase [Cyanobacteria bacterium UBA11368]